MGRTRVSKKTSILEHSVIQVTIIKIGNYIYCPGQIIDLFNSSYDCPNFVFSLPSNLSFSLGSYKYNAKALRVSKDIEISKDIYFYINLILGYEVEIPNN